MPLNNYFSGIKNKLVGIAMKMNTSHHSPDPQGSSDSHGKPIKRTPLAFLASRQLGVVWGLLLLTTAGNYAIFTGGTVVTEITPYGIRVEVVGRPR